MLADVGGNNGVGRQQFAQRFAKFERVDAACALGDHERMARLEFVHPAQPGRAFLRRDRREELAQHLARISRDGDVGGLDLVEFARVDLDVDDLRVFAKARGESGGAVVKTRADGHEQVGFVEDVIGAGRTVHPEHPKRKRVVARNGSQAHQRAGNRRADARGELQNKLPCVCRDDSAADVDDRALGLGDEARDARDRLRRTALGLRGRAGLGPGFHLAQALKNVLGNIDDHRAGPPGFGDLERSRDHIEEFLGAHHHEAVFGDGEREPKRIDLLKGIGAEQRTGDLARDGHQRHAVELRICDGREQVRRARSRSAQADGGPARDASHSLRDEPRALFVPREDVPDGAVVERVVEGQDRAAGNAGKDVNALAFQ